MSPLSFFLAFIASPFMYHFKFHHIQAVTRKGKIKRGETLREVNKSSPFNELRLTIVKDNTLQHILLRAKEMDILNLGSSRNALSLRCCLVIGLALAHLATLFFAKLSKVSSTK